MESEYKSLKAFPQLSPTHSPRGSLVLSSLFLIPEAMLSRGHAYKIVEACLTYMVTEHQHPGLSGSQQGACSEVPGEVGNVSCWSLK